MPTSREAARALSPVIRFSNRCGVRRLGDPLRVISATRLDDVLPVLAEVEREAAAGRFAAGFVSYEAAPAFDAALAVHAAGGVPLAWFAIYADSGTLDDSRAVSLLSPALLEWRAGCTEREYGAAVERIRALIAAGDTYQVNFTFPMHADFEGDASALFDALSSAQPTEYGCFIETPDFAVLSVSPELFFRLDGDTILCRPMKGTAARGLSSADDAERAEALQASGKERAENVMIVDMVRNDLGRIAETGSVLVRSLFDTERLGTCWQMTSTVEARSSAGIAEIFRALFPSASVTGAPKVRTMEIIRELEARPRGVYCGAIGWVGPCRRAAFSVGIRTLTIDRAAGAATYQVGSGITWESAASAEFDECRLKAAVLMQRRPEFELLESLLWDGEYWLMEGHFDRLRASAEYFGFAMKEGEIRAALEAFARTLDAPTKVRLRLSRFGAVHVEGAPLSGAPCWRVAVSPEPIDDSDVYLYHKTTQRSVYDRASALCPGADDVILWNRSRQLTESTRANLALRFGGQWYTPPVSCGLLGGVHRAQLLRDGALFERVMTLDDLEAAQELRLINSVRGWISIEQMGRPAILRGQAR